MEEKHPPQKQIDVTDASITFVDGTTFQASPRLLQELNKRVKKENNLSVPPLEIDCDICIQWIES